MIKVKEDMTGWVMSEHGVPNSRIKIIQQAEDYVSSSGVHYAQWLCECLCEQHKQFIARQDGLRSGKTASCGCLQKEKATKHCKSMQKANLYNVTDYSYGVGWTSNTNTEFYFDLEDYDKIKQYCWSEHIDKKSQHHELRAWIPEMQKTFPMHQFLGFKYYDHIDQNPLNNRKSNLRPCTSSQNSMNQPKHRNNASGVTGVHWHTRDKVWQAIIGVNYKQICLGVFNDKTDAIKARLRAEIEYFGEFAPQKHLFKEYGILNKENHYD